MGTWFYSIKSLRTLKIIVAGCLLCIVLVLSACWPTVSVEPYDNGIVLKSFEDIIGDGVVPDSALLGDDLSKEIFEEFGSSYTAGTKIAVRYVTPVGAGDLSGSSWLNAADNVKTTIDGIGDAAADKLYLVLIATGTYDSGATIVMKPHVAVLGGFKKDTYQRSTGATTILDGANARRIISNDSNGLTIVNALLYGLTMANGNDGGGGGGMFNKNSSPTIMRVVFSNNSSTNSSSGGAVYLETASPRFLHVDFVDNNADLDGGAIYAKTSSNPTFDYVTFSGNQSGNTGGVSIDSGSATFNHVTFSKNEGSVIGGAYFVDSSSGSTFNDVTFSENIGDLGGLVINRSSATFTDVVFSGNIGGGIYIEEGNSLVFNRVTFFNNSYPKGGGAYIKNASPIFINTTFANNNAGDEGGGIYLEGPGFATFINVTFSANTAAANKAAGISVYNSSTTNDNSPTFVNCLFWNNQDSNNTEKTAELNSTTVDRIVLSIYNSVLPEGTGNAASGTSFRNQGAFQNGGGDFITVYFGDIQTSDPKLDALADKGGKVQTMSISTASPVVNKGLYVKRSGTDFYYSDNGTDWYDRPGLGPLGPAVTPPADAEEITTVDARGYKRLGRPDLGAYESNGVNPK